ncbi:hypothetical protein N9Q36_01955 [Flavobacteriales bacterium]|jgi:hypothetical protein|nr:hypothetical protein [Flavobacteriales bacterium]|tara:strand:+ start:625 stop:1092 length:468 start_codon:yes stop_codon:yes gene_type:complete
MKNIILVFLLASIPFMSIAQKRSNKKTNAKMGEMKKQAPSAYEYMVIDGIQSTTTNDEKMMDQGELAARAGASGDIRMKGMLTGKYKHMVNFSTGRISPEQIQLNKMARVCNHMSDALYQASKLGWEFVSASHTSSEDFIMHYYYMKRLRVSDKK